MRHLRNCSALLDSPNAFRKALNALEQALERGHVEESQPLLYLQSLLSKIEPSHEVIEVSSEERDEERYFCSLSTSLFDKWFSFDKGLHGIWYSLSYYIYKELNLGMY